MLYLVNEHYNDGEFSIKDTVVGVYTTKKAAEEDINRLISERIDGVEEGNKRRLTECPENNCDEKDRGCKICLYKCEKTDNGYAVITWLADMETFDYTITEIETNKRIIGIPSVVIDRKQK